MAKLTKKKKITISVLVIVAAILIVAAIILGLVFRPSNIPEREDLGFETVCYELPDDNDPTAHTGIENIGYMNYRLQHQAYWYSEAHVKVTNSMDPQNVSTYKQYNNGVLISTDISVSNLVNKAVQYCQVRGGNVVLFRNSTGGKSAYNKWNTPWYQGKPDGHTVAEYKIKKGLPPLEFSVYILNEDTVKECSEVIDNGDGTYTQTFILNFADEPMENDATYWYKTEMAYKANGMMKENPEFSSVQITYTFDNTWQVLSSHNEEVYKTITGVGGVNCTAKGDTEYIYDNEELATNPEFENYYKNYLNDYEVPEDVVVDASLCLAEAFGGFMNGEVKLALDLDVDDAEYRGALQLNVPEMDIRVDLGNVKVYVGTDNYIYIDYGNNVKVKLSLDEITSATDSTSTPNADTDNTDTDDLLGSLLSALGDEQQFHLAEDGLSATLTPSIDIGKLLNIDLDLALDLEFKFNITKDKEITLDYVKASGNLLGADFGAKLAFSNKGVPAITNTQAYTPINIENLTSLFSAEAFEIGIAYNDNGVELEGTIVINVNDLQVKADLNVVLDGAVDAAKHLTLAYVEDTVYVTLYSADATPAMLKVNIDEALDVIGDLLGFIDPDTTAAEAEQESDILQTVLSLLQEIGTGNVLNFLLGDDGLHTALSVSGTDTVEIVIDGNNLLEKFGVEFDLGTVTATVEKNSLRISALGLTATLSGTDAFSVDTDAYVDATDLMPIVKDILGAIEDKKLSVSGLLTLEVEGITVELNIKALSIDWTDGIALDISAVATAGDLTKDIYVSYAGGVAKIAVGNIGVQLTDANIEDIIYAVTEILAQTELLPEGDGGIEDIFGALEDIDVFSLINSLHVSSKNGSIITLALEGFEISIYGAENGILAIDVDYSADVLSLSLTNALVTEYKAVEGDDTIEYFDGSYLVPLLNNVSKYVTDGGLTLNASLTIGDIAITVDNLSVSWLNGNVQINAKISVEFDSFAKSIYFEYGAEKAALYYDDIAVILGKDDYESFMDALQSLVGAIVDEMGGGGELPNVEQLLAIFNNDTEIESDDIFEILSKVGISKNNNGNLEITFEGVTVELIVDKNGNLSVNVAYVDGQTSFDIGLAVGEYNPVSMPTGCAEIDAAEIIPLINSVAEIIANKGITVSGAIAIGIGKTEVKLNIYGLSVDWKDGIALQLDARLLVGDSMHDIYAEYSQATGRLKLVYGSLDGGAGIDINLDEDIDSIKDALLTIYTKIANLVNNSVDGDKEVLPELGSLDELLDWILAGIQTAEDVAELAETVEDGQLSIADILSGIQLDYRGGVFTVEVMGITLTLSSTGNDTYYINVQTESLSLGLNDVKIVATEYTDLGVEVENALTAQDIVDLLDYLAATVELFVQDTFNISLTGEVTSTEEQYAAVDGVKYDISAGFEYQAGESGYPVHFVPESVTEEGDTVAPDFWIAPDMYVHLYVNMISTIDEVDSVLFDIYIFDGNPAVDSNGKTTAAALSSGDNELDVFMSISRVPKSGTSLKHEPVKIYAPMDEIMTVLSAGLALVDVGSISIDALPQLNGIITQVGSILDAMLVDRYFGNEKDRFTSLGEGLIDSILGSSLTDFINDLIDGLTGSEEEQEVAAYAEEVEEAEEGLMRERHGVVDKLSVDREGNTTTLTLTVGETTATVTKEAYAYTTGEGEETVEHSGTRLTNLNVDRSALNDTDTLEDLNIDLLYSGVSKPTSLSGYLSIEGVDSLVKALINSATHEIPEEQRTEENSAKYSLNNNFFIDGKITLSALSLLNVDVNIEGLSVIIDENGDVQVNLSMNYQGVKPIVTLINGDTSVDLSVKNGMVYIRRVQTSDFSGFLGTEKSITPITIYRAMPVDVFLDDMMEQMIFLFNFGDTIANAMRGGSSVSSEEGTKEDYGTQLNAYFTSFTFNENTSKDTAQWKAVINGDGLSQLSGITLGDITATIDAVKDSASAYVVNALGISGSLYSALSFTANLNWQNPQEDWNSFTSANKEAAAAQVVEKDPGATVRANLNNMTDEEIVEKLDWDRLATESGAGYIELKFNNSGAMTSTVQFKDVTVNYSVKDGIEDNAGEIYVTTDTQYALVNTSTNSIYSVLNYPDLTSYDIDGYSFVWLDPVYEGNDTYSVCARYVKTELEVTYYSSVKFTGSKVSSYTEGYGSTVYEQTVSFLSLSYGRPDKVSGSGYELVGWGYKTADGTWIAATDLRTIENLGYLDSIELHALWISAIEIVEKDCVRNNNGLSGYKYNSYLTLSFELNGLKELFEHVSITGSYSYSASATLSSTDGSGKFTATHTDGKFTFKAGTQYTSNALTKYSSWDMSVSFNFMFDNVNFGKTFTTSQSGEY